ncbi:MAG: hypothetical protein LBQ77_04580 [Treponema sp.]|nr:hypothetical protein [Treponema sp.]
MYLAARLERWLSLLQLTECLSQLLDWHDERASLPLQYSIKQYTPLTSIYQKSANPRRRDRPRYLGTDLCVL